VNALTKRGYNLDDAKVVTNVVTMEWCEGDEVTP
jgi:hypothetical protein